MFRCLGFRDVLCGKTRREREENRLMELGVQHGVHACISNTNGHGRLQFYLSLLREDALRIVRFYCCCVQSGELS